MPDNRLARETSPYLLQHRHNPVDWYPWGPEALERARREDKPIFLSVGYSACHWCHVMERECFEEPSIAALMNALYVNVKVDREERPDVDEIYMKAVTAMTGQGGWPMSVFLTPELEPFFGTTYLPPVRRYGRPSFPDVLVGLAEAWKNRRDDVVAQGRELARAIRAEAAADARAELPEDVEARAMAQLVGSYDREWGGSTGAPKFPHAGELRFLLRHHHRTGDAQALAMATHTLDRMAAGGMCDQLGGGFHRYSTDERWCIPHFEKMLYDNAQLVPAYLEAHLVTGSADYARVARECCEWVLREMVTPEGGFASAQDADSEGEEGRFFVWTPGELRQVLGDPLAAWVAAAYDVSERGNFEGGTSALWLPRPMDAVASELGVTPDELRAGLADARKRLLAARGERVAPMTDDKVLASWNGLMIGAMARAHQVLGDARYLEAARAAAANLLERMRQPDGRLHATARAGRAHVNACLDDYAFVIQGLLDLYESDFDLRWLREAQELAELVEGRFADAERGGYFSVGEDHEPLIARLKSVHDGALPAGAGVHALSLARLAALTGREELRERAWSVVRSQAAMLARVPRAFAQLLLAVDFLRAEVQQVVVSGERGDTASEALLQVVRRSFEPARVVAFADRDADAAGLPLLRDRGPTAARPSAAFVCHGFVCDAPVTAPQALSRLL